MNKYAEGDKVKLSKTILEILQKRLQFLEKKGSDIGGVKSAINKMIETGFGDNLIDDIVVDENTAIEFFRREPIVTMTPDMRENLRSQLSAAANKNKLKQGEIFKYLKEVNPTALTEGLLPEQLADDGRFFVTAKPKAAFGLRAAVPYIYNAIPNITNQEAKLVATIGAFSGLRPEELYRVTAAQIDLVNMEITNVGGKKGGPLARAVFTGGKTYTLSPLALEVASQLKDGADESGKLFKSSLSTIKSKIKTAVIEELAQADKVIDEAKKAKGIKVVKSSSLNADISKGKHKGFNVKLFRDIIQTGGRNIGIGALDVKEMVGHALKGSDIQLFYTSGERILPGINESMRYNATRLQNAFLKNAGFESPREFGIAIGLGEEKIGKLETALIEPAPPTGEQFSKKLPAEQEIIDESKTRTSTQASKEVRETAAEKIAREQARTTGLQGRVQELESAAAKTGTRAGTGKSVAREGGKQVLKKLGLLGVGAAVGTGIAKTIIGGPIGAATTVAQLGIDQYVNPREFKKSEEYQPYQLAKKIQSQEKGLRSFISSDEAVKANYEKLHGMGYSKRDALSQGKEKQLQSRENLKSQLASIFT